MRRNVRRLNREVNAGLKQPREQQPQEGKEELALRANGRTKRRKAASLTELKRFYDAAVDAASEVLSITAAGTTADAQREQEEAAIAGKGRGSVAAGDDQHHRGTALLAVSSSADEHVPPPLSTSSVEGGNNGETPELMTQRTAGTIGGGNNMKGKCSTRHDGDASGEQRRDKGGDRGNHRYRSPALLMLSADDSNTEWHRRGTKAIDEKGIAAESSGEAFREVLRKKLEATGGTQCKLGSTKRRKTNRATTSAVENTEASRRRGGSSGTGGAGGGGGDCASLDTMNCAKSVASDRCLGEAGGNRGSCTLHPFSGEHAGKKSGKGTVSGERKLGNRQQSSSTASSLPETHSSYREAIVAPRGPCVLPTAVVYPSLPGFEGHVRQSGPPASTICPDAAPPRLPPPPYRAGWYARSSPALGLSPALLEALETAEAMPHADVVVPAVPPSLKAPFSESRVEQCARLQPEQAGMADAGDETGRSGAWREDAPGRPCIKAPFTESSLVKPAELLLRVCGKDSRKRNAVTISRGQSAEKAGTAPPEPAMGAGAGDDRGRGSKASTDDGNNNIKERSLPGGRAPLMPYWRRRQEPPRPAYNGISSSSSSSSSSCSSSSPSSAGTSASTGTSSSASSSARRVTFSPSTWKAGSSPTSTARAPVAASPRKGGRRAAAAAASAASAAAGPPSEDEDDGDYPDCNVNDDGAYVGIPVRFGIMQQRQFNRFPGNGRAGAGPSSSSQQGEKKARTGRW